MGNYYAHNTDVWVYGSPPQYSEFADVLSAHTSSLRIPADHRGGMDVLMLPPAKLASREFLVMHERLVHQEGRFNMELILGGSKGGFKSLANFFRRSANDHAGDLENHLHVDCGLGILVLPSVFLHINGPVPDIDAMLPTLAPGAPSDLLPDMEWRNPELWDYEPLEAYEDLFGRIPVKRRASRSKGA